VTVTDLNGCTATASTTVNGPSSALSATAAQSNPVTCFNGSDGTATATPGGGWDASYTYAWSSDPLQNTQTATGLAPGNYIVTVTDLNGCTSTASATVTGPSSALSATAAQSKPVTCFNGSDGTATITPGGGWNASYTYAWSSVPLQNTPAATGLSAGNYTVTVTDLNGCTATASAMVTGPSSALSATAAQSKPVTCFNGSDGTATVTPGGGWNASYSYAWSSVPLQNTPAATGLAAGSYTVTVIDLKGCTATASATVSQPDVLTALAFVVSPVSIYEGSDGSITVSAGGGTTDYSYIWSTSPVRTTQAATGLSAGTYWVTVTDANACMATSSTTLTQPTPPSGQATDILFSGISSSQMIISWTRGNGDGCAVFMFQGTSGTAPPENNQSYPANPAFGDPASQVGTSGWYCVFDGTGTTVSVTGLSPSTGYRVHVCEYKLGSKTYNTNTSANNPGDNTTHSQLTATASVVSNVSCYAGNDGSVTAIVDGGNPSYSYSWSTTPAQATQTATGLTAGTYTVTVTDVLSATVTSSVTVTQPSQWWPGLTGPTPVCQNATGNVYTTETGMTDYQWVVSPGGTITSGGTDADPSVTVTWTAAATQSVTVNYTTPAGCMAVEATSMDVMVNPAPTPLITGESTVKQGQTVTYTTPYVPSHTYTWNASHGNAVICFPHLNCITILWDFPCGIINPGFVTVTETDPATGCRKTATKLITITM